MAQMIDVLLPADQAEGTRSQVLRWLKSIGDPVAKHEPLVEIETDKVTIEVPAPADGILGEIAAAEGMDVAPGALLGRLQAGGSVATAVPAAAARPAPVAAKAAIPAAASNAAGRMSPAVRRLLAERGLDSRCGAGQRRGRAHHRGRRARRSQDAGLQRRRLTRRDCAAFHIRRCAGVLRRTWSKASCARRRT